jgi:hypothetical protein
MKDQCKCGRPKDKRAETCRSCCFPLETVRRKCTSCKTVKPVADFRIRTRAVPRPRSVCKVCEARQTQQCTASKPRHLRKAATRKWEKQNPLKHKQQLTRRRIRVLGLESEMTAIIARLNEQAACEICGITDLGDRYKSLCIDHNHQTKRFRGLLCTNCNQSIGKFKDDPSLLLKAAAYLSRSNLF